MGPRKSRSAATRKGGCLIRVKDQTPVQNTFFGIDGTGLTPLYPRMVRIMVACNQGSTIPRETMNVKTVRSSACNDVRLLTDILFLYIDVWSAPFEARMYAEPPIDNQTATYPLLLLLARRQRQITRTKRRWKSVLPLRLVVRGTPPRSFF